MKHMCYHI